MGGVGERRRVGLFIILIKMDVSDLEVRRSDW